jgi:hypothetical protein
MSVNETVKGTEWKVKVISGAGYVEEGRTLCTIKNTGNGFIAKFPSWTNAKQDNYVCLAYDEADYLVKGLTKLMKDWENKNECIDN